MTGRCIWLKVQGPGLRPCVMVAGTLITWTQPECFEALPGAAVPMSGASSGRRIPRIGRSLGGVCLGDCRVQARQGEGREHATLCIRPIDLAPKSRAYDVLQMREYLTTGPGTSMVVSAHGSEVRVP